MSKFKLSIDEVNAGWATVSCSVSGIDLGLKASCLRDSLAELITATSGIVACRGHFAEPRRVHWILEPGSIEWHLTGGDDGTLILSAREHEQAFATPERHTRVLATATVPAARLVRSVLRAFDDLYDRVGPRDYETRWNHPWPAEAIARLREMIRT